MSSLQTVLWSPLRRAAARVQMSVAGFGGDAQSDSLFLVTGGGEWAVKEIAVGVQPHLAPHFRNVTILDQVTQRPYLSRGNVHCLCRPAFFKGGGIPHLHASNRLVVSWLHGGKHSDSPEIVAACGQLERHWQRVRHFVVPNSRTLADVLDCGVDERMISVIPNGVNTRLFQPCESPQRRDEIRQALGIPRGAFVVGSFQRDEDDDGHPKLVKGPDVLIAALAAAQRRMPVHALLTGPSRRYVKQGLERHGVPFTHAEQGALSNMSQMYHALDAYCVSSREEGGPAPLRESMASAVPVVSTRVGLAIDLIEHARNGFVVDVEDAAGLASGLVQLAEDRGATEHIAAAALETIRALDYSVIARRYREEVYLKAFA